jgi:hypothetical protein
VTAAVGPRPTIPLAVGVAGYGSELFFAFRGNTRIVGPQAVERFARTFREVLLG